MTKECVWNQEEEGSDTWYAGCGGVFSFSDDGPNTGFIFCPYCGSKMNAQEYEEPEDEDEDEDEDEEE